MSKNYYDILGISKEAKINEIKRAYKRLAIKYHPDRNKGEKIYEEKFKEIKEAYEVLSDSKKRAMYDQYGHAAFNQDNNYSSSGFSSDFDSSADFSDIFSDVFGDIFGSKNKKKKKNKGSDINYDLDLDLEDVIKGVSKEIKINLIQKCSVCHGNGCRPGTKRQICNICKGYGNIKIRQGFFTIQQTCSNCNGNCYIINDICYICRGSGKEKFYKKLFIKIPSGVSDNDIIRIPGKGNYGGYGSKNGDLYIKIRIKKHPIFDRKNNDLYCKIPISFSMSALGGIIEIPTLYNKVKIKIPPETQTGSLFRIKNKGLKLIRYNKYGDLLCEVFIETPVNLNKYQKKLLYNFGNSLLKTKKKNNPKSESFFNKIKRFFNSF